MAAGASGPTMTFGSKKKKNRSIWDDPDAVEIISIPLDNLHANPFNPRLVFRDEDIDELTESIKAEGGVLQDLSVAEVEPFLTYWRTRLAETQPDKLEELEEQLGSVPGDDYVTLIGHNRCLALKRAGETEAPCKVTNGKIPRARLLGLPENMRRIPLNPIEEALGFQGALDDGMTQTEVAAQTGCKQPHISRRVKLLNLPPEVQQAVMGGALAVSEAEVLLDRLTAPDHLVNAWLVMKEEGLKAAFAAARVLAPSTTTKPKADQKNKKSSPVPPQQRQSPGEPAEESSKSTRQPQAETPDDAADKTPADRQPRREEPAADEPDPSDEAAQLRVQACRTVVELGVPSNPRETLRVLAPALLLPASRSARETAHEWLRSSSKPIGPDVAKPDRYFAEVSDSGNAKLTAHVALAVALAVSEERAADATKAWDAHVRDYLAHLKTAVNYEPTAWEQDRLNSQ
ncbi:ParB/RepB/Spo0J family partition protein (plasmid) [Streptomyces sp. SDT5-1]|uniref:ParB/RepB/Spo0J family partition protein n=1 Tax=Streptomyces sp. SDT5-1 TaxID=3406418 RepID=UPI003FD65AB0